MTIDAETNQDEGGACMRRFPWLPLLGVGVLLVHAVSAKDFETFRDADRRAFEQFQAGQAPEAPAQSTVPEPLPRIRDTDSTDSEALKVYDSKHFRIRYRDSIFMVPDDVANKAGLYETAFERFVTHMRLRDPRAACSLEDGRILITIDNSLSRESQDLLEKGQWNGTFWLNEWRVPKAEMLQRLRANFWVLFAIQHAYGDSAAARRWLGTALRESAALGMLSDDETQMLLEANALGAAYFRLSISDNRHGKPGNLIEHGTTHFIHYLIHKGGVDFKALFEVVMNSKEDAHYGVLQNHIAATTERSLGAFYRDFVRRAFLGGAPGPHPEPHRRSTLAARSGRVRETFTLPANCTAAAWSVALQPGPESVAPVLALSIDQDLPANVSIDVMDPSLPPGEAPVCTLSAGRRSAVIQADTLDKLLALMVNPSASDCKMSLTVARFGIAIQPGGQIVLDLAAGTSEAEVELQAQATPPGDYRVEWDFGDGETFTENLSPEHTESKAAHRYTDLKHGQNLIVSARLFDADAGADDAPLAKDAATFRVSLRDDAADWECGVDFDWSKAEKIDVNFETYYRFWDTTNGKPGVPVRHGPRWIYHDKDKHKLKARGCYKHGVQVGRWTSWFRNGAMNSDIRYLEGKVTGPVKRWWENGNPRTSGTLVAQNHESIWEVNLGINIWDRLFEAWYENGKYQRTTMFRTGVKEGKHRSWYENGQLEYETDFKENLKHGVHSHWKEDGAPDYESRYHEDRMHGLQVYFTKWGERQEATYEKGEQQGIWLRYTRDGRVLWRRSPPWDMTGVPWQDTATYPPPKT
jgi:antitoxin component YwqK of YwqJK toxin-antitoxin module